MNICFYNHTGKISGAERVLLAIMSALDQNEHSAVLFAPSSEGFHDFCKARRIRFAEVSSLQARYTVNPIKLFIYIRSVLNLILELRRRIQEERPEIVHANTARSAIVAVFATAGQKVKLFWHIHDNMPRHPLTAAIQLVAVLSRRSRFIAVSQATADHFVAGMPNWLRKKTPISVVHNGVDIDRFQLGEVDHRFLQQVGLEAEHFRIGIVGQITPRKGHLELIRYLAPLFKTSLPHGRLLVVGSAMFNRDQDYLELLKNEVNRLGLGEHVLFLGPRDVVAVMKSLNVLVLNSSDEPFGLVLIEAMASGTPVVAAAVDGVPEIVEHGVSGLLFSPGDNPAFVSHICAIAQDRELVRNLVRAGRERVMVKFNQKLFQSQILNLYRTV